MIVDKLENITIYNGLGDRFKKAFEYLTKTNFKELENGKYSIEEDTIFAIVMEYATKDANECKLEAHKKYADIQYIIEGEEQIGVAILKNQIPTTAYNSEKDCAFYTAPISLIKLETGLFAIFMPHDIHMPGIQVNESKSLKKVVVKVKL
ncbi:MAG: YhcH/YjgK/YiaL family protein [Bacteroidetes bacterium]|nr:YhcH/YjgK/YiaL family protein [Bacteroidota bacterium]